MAIVGKNILITGGSRGLGKELAHTLATAGARVVIVGRDTTTINQVASNMRREGLSVYAIQGDAGSKEDVYRITAVAFEHLGSIDILINNAATLGPTTLRLLLDTDCEDIESAIQTNVLGPFRLTKAVAGNMLLNGGGTIVNITSDAAIEAYPEWGAYGVSKASLEHLTHIMAVESRSARLNFILLDPGEMDTALHAQALPDADRQLLNKPCDVASAVRNYLQQEPRESFTRLTYKSIGSRLVEL